MNGALLGFGVAGVFSALAVLDRALVGAARFNELGVALPTVVAVYFVTLPLCGVLGALVKPLLYRSAFGATILGALAAIPAVAGIMLIMPRRQLGWGEAVTVGLCLAFLFGGAFGHGLWRSDHPADD